MKKLLCAVIILCAAGVSMGGDAWVSIEIYRQNAFSIEECEYLKTILPKYSNYLNNIIIARMQGKDIEYEFEVWAEPYGEKAVSATLYRPGGASIPLKWDGGEFYYETDETEPPLQYFSMDDFAADFPSGQYRVDVKFVSSGTKSYFINVPDYDTTPFPGISDAYLSQDLSGQLILNWDTVENADEYNVWADSLKGFNELYDEDFYFSYPHSESTPLGILKSKGDYELGVSAYKWVNNDVEFTSDTHVFSFKNPLPDWDNRVDKSTVKAGVNNLDSISFSGILDAIEADFILADGNNVVVTIDSNLMPSPKTINFPINSTTFKKGKYTSKNANSSFSFDSKTHKMAFSAKNVNLTGLACPASLKITIGDYEAELELIEEVVNSTKSSPFELMMGVQDKLTVTKYKLKPGKTAGTDTFTAQGIFTIDGIIVPLEPFVIGIGSQTFTVPGTSFINKSGVYSCKNVAVTGGTVSATLDTNKCTFTLIISKATITQKGVVNFGMDCFGNKLEGLAAIDLGDPFIGIRTGTIYGNNNIRDNFSVDEIESGKIETLKSSDTDYAIKISGSGGKATFSMAKKSDVLLALNPQPQDITWVVPNAYMFSDGWNDAFLFMGQEDYDPLDISIRVGAWTRRPSVVTGAQLAGQWKIKWVFDNNLMVNVDAPFGTSDETLTITDLGNNQVRAEFGGGINWVMNIVGNRLVPVGPISSTIAHFSAATDGSGISMALIGFNSGTSVVSARIGLAER